MEFPLSGDDALDLQQRIRYAPEVDRLTRFLRRAAGNDGLPQDSAWSRVLQFCRTRLLTGEVEELWLELDNTGSSGIPPLSVFIRLPETPAQSLPLQTVERLLSALGAGLNVARLDALERCLGACSAKAGLSHLGLMTGRPGAPVRLIVDGVDAEGISTFLDLAGYLGNTALVQQYADQLFAHADRIRLALTVGDCLQPVLGLECFIGRPGENDPRWRCILDLLVREGLCRPERRDRILAWPKALTPAVASGDWPHPLVLDALVRSPGEIGWLDCRISHVKITLGEDRAPSAKAYFGFLAIWEDVAGEAPANVPKPVADPVGLDLDPAIASALDFLLGARTQAGWWLDYDGFREGVSDEWVTAYVAGVMDESRDSRAEGAARRAWTLLSLRGRAGWGWNALQPADADSTLWALHLAERVGASGSEPARTAMRFLEGHLLSDGGVATYRQDSRDGWPEGTEVNPEWYAAHVCVTAAAGAVGLLGDGPGAFLLRTQSSEGCWAGYWWQSPAYATAHAAEALAGRGTVACDAGIDRAVRWAQKLLEAKPSSSNPNESPFVTALALRLLLQARTPFPELIAAGTQRLLAARLADGSWAASALLSIPNSCGQMVPAVDNRRVFTTATVLRTLLRLRPVSGRPA